MKKKICFFDIDGTLTDERESVNGTIPQSTIDALNKSKAAGVILMVNTGRPKSTIPASVLALPMDGYVCGCGTHIIYQGEDLIHEVLSLDQLKKIDQFSKEHRISCVLEGASGYAVMDYNQCDIVKKIDETYHKDGFIKLPWDEMGACFEKFCLFINEDEVWPSFEALNDYHIIHRGTYFKEVVPKPYSKGEAVLTLLKKFQIDLDDCYGFGDSENDLPMLEVMKHSIVMGNSSEKVKSFASYITSASWEDGIAKAMIHFGLIQE